MAVTHSFSVGLAEKYGPIESIILSNICWWVETNRKNGKHCYDGKFWTYGSTASFEKIFCYLKSEQIKYTLRSLRDRGALITANYNRMRYDRTLWYTVSDEVLAIYECRKSGREAPEGEGNPPAEGEEKFSAGEVERADSEDHREIPGDEGEDGGDEADSGDIPDSWGDVVEGPEDGPVREYPNGHLHCGNLHDGNAQTGACIVEIPTMDCGNLHDPLWEFPPPIPFININKKAAAAKSGDENGGNEKIVKDAAAAAVSILDGKSLQTFLAGRKACLVFGEEFYRRAINWMRRHALDPSGYIDWLVEECEKRKPANMRGMFYRLFFMPDLVDLYKARGIPPPGERESGESLTCPACGEVHGAGCYECPRCGLRKDRYGDPAEVDKQKRINALEPKEKREYEREIRELFFSGKGKERDQWTEIQRKYHIIR